MSDAVKMSMPPSLTVSASAVQKVYELMKDEDNFNLKLRVYIEGGGCSGFQYGFTFDEENKQGDTVITKDVADEADARVEVLIDPMSYQYLVGAEIDYKNDLEGERFIIRNPNAKTTCGCGSSFAV